MVVIAAVGVIRRWITMGDAEVGTVRTWVIIADGGFGVPVAAAATSTREFA